MRDDEGDTLRIRLEYSEDGEVVNDTLSEVVLVPEYFYDGSWRRARVGNYYFKVECSDVDIGVSDSVLIQIDNLGVPRGGILNTFAGEYSDSVRFDYRVLDEEGDPVVLVVEYSLDGV